MLLGKSWDIVWMMYDDVLRSLSPDDFGILFKCQIAWGILGGSLGSKGGHLCFFREQCASSFK